MQVVQVEVSLRRMYGGWLCEMGEDICFLSSGEKTMSTYFGGAAGILEIDLGEEWRKRFRLICLALRTGYSCCCSLETWLEFPNRRAVGSLFGSADHGREGSLWESLNRRRRHFERPYEEEFLHRAIYPGMFFPARWVCVTLLSGISRHFSLFATV